MIDLNESDVTKWLHESIELECRRMLYDPTHPNYIPATYEEAIEKMSRLIPPLPVSSPAPTTLLEEPESL
jgi:hypothetical protein